MPLTVATYHHQNQILHFFKNIGIVVYQVGLDLLAPAAF